MVLLDIQVQPVNHIPDLLAKWVKPDNKGLLDKWAQRVHPVKPVIPVKPVPLARPDKRVQLVKWVKQVQLVK
jgi:hypothetical protein